MPTRLPRHVDTPLVLDRLELTQVILEVERRPDVGDVGGSVVEQLLETRARCTDLVDDRLCDLEREAPPAVDRTAEVVPTSIRRVANELIEQVAVGGVDRASGGSSIVFGDAGQLVDREGSRHHERFHARCRTGLARSGHGGWPDRSAAGDEVWMRHAAGVPEL